MSNHDALSPPEMQVTDKNGERITKVEIDVEFLREEQKEFREQLKEMFKQHHTDMSNIAVKHNEDMLKFNSEITEVHKIIAGQNEKHNTEIAATNKALETTNTAFNKLNSTVDKWAQRLFGAIVLAGVLLFIGTGNISEVFSLLTK